MARKRLSVDEFAANLMDSDAESDSEMELSSEDSWHMPDESDSDDSVMEDDEDVPLDEPTPRGRQEFRGARTRGPRGRANAGRGRGAVRRVRGLGLRQRGLRLAGLAPGRRIRQIGGRQNQVPVHLWSDIPQDPPVFPFNEDPGLKVQVPVDTPGAYFDLFLTADLLDVMVVETNRYANAEINKERPLRRESRLKDWKDTDATEMKQFIGLMLHMGPYNLPTIEHYWSKNIMYRSPFFSGIMSRNRFQLLLRFLHFADNETPNNDRLYKVCVVVDKFNDVMNTMHYPGKDLSIDESMVLWQGRLLFRQYIKNKRHKYGIKLYELCESQGLVLKVRVYSGIGLTDDLGLGQSAAIVLNLMDGYLDKGHVVYADNYYNSVSLVKQMTERSTYICGTLCHDRKENPKDVVKHKLSKGEHVWKRSGSVVVCKWKDKRDVLTISNMHSIEMVDVRNRNNKLSRKPNTVRDYNQGMSGIDRSDQMLSYYSGLRKTIRWYKKIALHLLEMSLLNAFILYNTNRPEPMKLLQFRELVTVSLLGEAFEQIEGRVNPRAGLAPDAMDFHHLSALPPTEKKQRPTKPCRMCTRAGMRRETRYMCEVCPEKPALCVEKCFKKFHAPE